MQIVMYDIASERRLYRVERICEDYGIRIQQSVFECDLSEKDFSDMWQELNDAIDEREDRVTCYWICAACLKRKRSMGEQAEHGRGKALIF